jgi:transcriptional regulator with XRE-family HTH domain
MNFGNTIADLRGRSKLSQQEVADSINVARSTYAALEANRRQPNLSEIQFISELYQIAPADLISGNISSEESIIPFMSEQTKVMPRELHPEANPAKLREVLLYILEKVGAKPNVGETVLYKLLYFIDFDYYEKYGQSITGLTYVRNHFGPTPAHTFKEVVEGLQQQGELEVIETKFFSNNQRKYLPTKNACLDLLNAKELNHINEELERLSDKNAAELSDLSHKDTPWRVAKAGGPINYRDVFYRTDMTAVTEPEDEL